LQNEPNLFELSQILANADWRLLRSGGRRCIPLAPSVAAALICTFVLRSLQRNHPVSTTVAAFS